VLLVGHIPVEGGAFLPGLVVAVDMVAVLALHNFLYSGFLSLPQNHRASKYLIPYKGFLNIISISPETGCYWLFKVFYISYQL
jgi:hypothetical protein